MISRLGRRIACAILLLTIIAAAGQEAQAAPVRVIVKLRAGSIIRPVLGLLNAQVLDVIPETNAYLLKTDTALVKVLSPWTSLLLGVVYIDPDPIVLTPSLISSGLLSAQDDAAWYREQPAFARVRANRLPEGIDGSGAIVADINSRVDYGHQALQGRLTAGYDFVMAQGPQYAELNQSSASFLDQSSASFLDQSSYSFLDQSSLSFLDQSSLSFLDQSAWSFLDQSSLSFLDQSSLSFLDGVVSLGLVTRRDAAYSHGTLCAGIIAAVAPRAMIMPLRVFDDEGRADVFTIAKAIRYAAKNGAHVINMSFGMSVHSRTVQEQIEAAAAAGIVVVASAGNADTSTPQYPAAYAPVISVAATDLFDRKAPFSNFGSTIEVTAPGVEIISAFPGGYYASASGTSFAAPIVAAEAALIRSQGNAAVRKAILASAVDIDARNSAYAGQLGRGRIDVSAALGR